jgi:hypothetical protein
MYLNTEQQRGDIYVTGIPAANYPKAFFEIVAIPHWP